MKRTIVLCVSWKGPSEPTRLVLESLRTMGALTYTFSGVTDVSLARSMALSQVLDSLDGSEDVDTILMLDDDIAPSVHNALELVERCRALNAAVSGVYGTAEGKVAATMYGRTGRWLTGLGFFAVPLRTLQELGEHLPRLEHMGRTLRQWCATGAHPANPGTWTSEDYWLCLELGGVELASIPADHYKLCKVTVPPSALEAIERANASVKAALPREPPARFDAQHQPTSELDAGQTSPTLVRP